MVTEYQEKKAEKLYPIGTEFISPYSGDKGVVKSSIIRSNSHGIYVQCTDIHSKITQHRYVYRKKEGWATIINNTQIIKEW